MPPTERPLESATIHHVALSVGGLETMAAFYAALGFDEVSRLDLAPAPIRLATVANDHGARIELVANDDSEPAIRADPITASRRRGPFHFAVAVAKGRLTDAVTAAVAAGASVVTEPTMNSSRDSRFAYIADPEGNLIELISPLPEHEPGMDTAASRKRSNIPS